MPHIRIEGLKPYDGTYELDPDLAFNVREWRLIKTTSGYMPLTITEGFQGGDPELYLALAIITMVRAGKVSKETARDVYDELAEAPYEGQIMLVGDDVEDEDEIPLVSPSETDVPSPSVSLAKPSTSGDPSPTGSVRSDETSAATTRSRLGISSA